MFIEYPKCPTCQKAKKWLDEQGVSYKDRHIVEQNPTEEELRTWLEAVSYTHLERTRLNRPDLWREWLRTHPEDAVE